MRDESLAVPGICSPSQEKKQKKTNNIRLYTVNHKPKGGGSGWGEQNKKQKQNKSKERKKEKKATADQMIALQLDNIYFCSGYPFYCYVYG